MYKGFPNYWKPLFSIALAKLDFFSCVIEVLKEFLNEEEMLGLNNFTIINEALTGTVNERGWWGGWKSVWEGYVCGGPYCSCYYLRYKRECHQFGDNYFQYATVQACSGAALPSGGWC